jgi:hypothetical protein
MKDEIISTNRPKIEVATAIMAIVMAVTTLLLLASLHFLSPQFDPSFRMVSEYAFGHCGWVLSLMFLFWSISSWSLAAALRSQVQTRAGKVGWWFLVIAGRGEAMAAVFDVTHEVGHGIAGLLGVLGFPVAALLLSVNLGRLEAWRDSKKALIWLANLNWISVVLLVATLVLMTIQMTKANGGHLPQHAPRRLPPGVLGLDRWADRLIILTNCLWVVAAGWGVKNLYGKSAHLVEPH